MTFPIYGKIKLMATKPPTSMVYNHLLTIYSPYPQFLSPAPAKTHPATSRLSANWRMLHAKLLAMSHQHVPPKRRVRKQRCQRSFVKKYPVLDEIEQCSWRLLIVYLTIFSGKCWKIGLRTSVGNWLYTGYFGSLRFMWTHLRKKKNKDICCRICIHGITLAAWVFFVFSLSELCNADRSTAHRFFDWKSSMGIHKVWQLSALVFTE